MIPIKPASQREKGATLLTVLLIIALMSVAAVAATDALARSIGVSRISDDRAGSFWAARAGTSAGELIVTDLMASIEGELTAEAAMFQEPVIFAYERGSISITLREATNCFNLNMLETEENGPQLERLRELLEGAGFFASEARQLAEALADWMDGDTSTRPSGAEDSVYAARSVPHLSAGTRLVSINDLRAIEGYTPEVLFQLKGLVCVRAAGVERPLNINTLTLEEAPVLAARFSPEMSAREAERAILNRPEGGWLNAEEFLAMPDIARIAPQLRSDGAISIISSYIEADMRIRSGSVSVHMTALYGRGSEGNFVLLDSHRSAG